MVRKYYKDVLEAMDDQDDEIRLPRAFCVDLDPSNIDLTLPPATGEEYIQRVMFEAKQCDSVVVAEINPIRLKQPTVLISQNNGCPAAPPSLLPSHAWQEKQVADFSNLRMKISRLKLKPIPKPPVALPKLTDSDGWHKFCIGSSDCGIGKEPLISIMLNISQPLIETLLEFNLNWLRDAKKLSDRQGQWLFSLMACLELPLTPDVCSILRDIARVCATIRANEVNLDQKDVTSLNLIICLVARYFRQTDLADNP